MRVEDFQKIAGGSYTIVETPSHDSFLVALDVDSGNVDVFCRTSLAGHRPRYDRKVAVIESLPACSFMELYAAVCDAV